MTETKTDAAQGPQNILVLRVLCFALCFGVAVFAAIAIVLFILISPVMIYNLRQLGKQEGF